MKRKYAHLPLVVTDVEFIVHVAFEVRAPFLSEHDCAQYTASTRLNSLPSRRFSACATLWHKNELISMSRTRTICIKKFFLVFDTE